MNPEFKDTNPLAISWHDTTRIPSLNPSNVLDYFCDRCNPFYLKTCNNEILRMQNRDMEQLTNMVGVEYMVLHVQEPILYVIRKQHRMSPTQVTPLSDYYVLAGTVYQAPDLHSVVNSRLTTCAHHLISAFDETMAYMKYHPTKGYSWHFDSQRKEKRKDLTHRDSGSSFQRRRVDMLLAHLSKKFPPVSQSSEGKEGKEGKESKDTKPAGDHKQPPDSKRPAVESLGPAVKVLRPN